MNRKLEAQIFKKMEWYWRKGDKKYRRKQMNRLIAVLHDISSRNQSTNFAYFSKKDFIEYWQRSSDSMGVKKEKYLILQKYYSCATTSRVFDLPDPRNL